jgi:hypothetical protein
MKHPNQSKDGLLKTARRLGLPNVTTATPYAELKQRVDRVLGRTKPKPTADEPRLYHGSHEAALEASDRELYR